MPCNVDIPDPQFHIGHRLVLRASADLGAQEFLTRMSDRFWMEDRMRPFYLAGESLADTCCSHTWVMANYQRGRITDVVHS